jgi:hypothetical protein
VPANHVLGGAGPEDLASASVVVERLDRFSVRHIHVVSRISVQLFTIGNIIFIIIIYENEEFFS